MGVITVTTLGSTFLTTAGIISGLHREIPGGGSTPALVDLIQTDAAISPGNSGGALLDEAGNVVGINVAYIPPGAGAVSLGFAIPAPVAARVADQLISTGEVSFAYLGIRPVQVTPALNQAYGIGSDTGALVAEVVPGSPAARAGIKSGGVIVRIDDREIAVVEDIFAELREASEGYDEQVSRAVASDADTQAYVEDLEERADEIDEADLPSGEALAAELTRFLRERDRENGPPDAATDQ